MDGKQEVREQIERAQAYREVFQCNDGVPTGAGKVVYDDLLRFAGLFQAKYEGEAHDMTKTLGRVEVVGRLNYFLNLDTVGLSNMIKEDKDAI